MSVQSADLDVQRSAPKGAVFLSYASQDAEAARRLCDGLRSAGVEVWFDQNELVGGDAWDAKIRKQIAECALFVPIISANTQARREGYFRIEWRLAAQRTHAISDDTPFLLPVVIDDTRDADARVPAEFKGVQWTRLRPSDEGQARDDANIAVFCARVQQLLGDGSELEPRRPRAVGGDEVAAASGARASTPKRRPRAVGFAAALVAFAVIAVVVWSRWKHATPPPAAVMPPISEASRLVANAWEQMDKTEMARNELLLAEGYCRQAAALEPTNPAVWAAWSAMNTWYCFHGFELLPARKEAARDYAQKALAIDPKSYDARYAWAHFIVRLGFNPGEEKPALPVLRELLRERPDEPRALYDLGFGLVADPTTMDEGFTLLERLAEKHPWFAGRALNELGWTALFQGRFATAESAAERAVKAQPYWNNLGLKATLALRLHGDVGTAQDMVNRLPPSAMQENWGISLAVMVADWRGDYTRAIAILESVSRDWLENFFYWGPTPFLSGLMRLKAKQATAAEKDFRRAMELIAPRLEKSPNDRGLLYYKAEAQRLLGLRDEAEKTYRQMREIWPSTPAQLDFEPPEQALDYVRQMVERGYTIDYPPAGWWFTAASLRHDPLLENVRRAPGFKALLDEVELREKQRWSAKPISTGAKTAGRPAEQLNAPEKSIAVLAFKNLSGDPAREFFSDGLSEAVADVLGRVPGLKVVGSTSAFSFKGKAVPIPEIARQLGVTHVLEGTVLQDGANVRITAKLLKADGFPVWVSDKLERPVKSIFALHDEIAGQIARSLELKLGFAASAAGEVNPEAYQAYLTGRAVMARAGMEELRQALPHFERAAALAPRFTPAWVQMAVVHTQLGRWGGSPTQQAWAAAHGAIERAMALEPDSPDVLLALGWIRRTAEWDWRGAERTFRRALELRPNHPDTLSGAAVLLFNIGKTDEAFQLSRQAVQLDPLNPATQIDLGLMFFFNESWLEAERAARRALELGPGGAGYHAVLAWSLAAQQRHAEAEAELTQEPSEVERINGLGMMAVARGQVTQARRYLARLEEIARTDHIKADLHQSIAWLCASLGEKDRAFAALENARASRDPSVAWSRTMWPLRPLYTDPRWADFLRSIGLSDGQLK